MHTLWIKFTTSYSYFKTAAYNEVRFPINNHFFSLFLDSVGSFPSVSPSSPLPSRTTGGRSPPRPSQECSPPATTIGSSLRPGWGWRTETGKTLRCTTLVCRVLSGLFHFTKLYKRDRHRFFRITSQYSKYVKCPSRGKSGDSSLRWKTDEWKRR